MQCESWKDNAVSCEFIFGQQVYLVMLEHSNYMYRLILLNWRLSLFNNIPTRNNHIRTNSFVFIRRLTEIGEVAAEDIHVRAGNYVSLADPFESL